MDVKDGIYIRCHHDIITVFPPLPNSPPSPPKQLTVKIIARIYQRIVYHSNNNGRHTRLISRHKYPCPQAYNYLQPLSPLCLSCRGYIFSWLINNSYNPTDARRELERFSIKVRHKVYSMFQDQNQNMDDNTNKDEVIRHELHKRGPDRVCNQEQYQWLVDQGEVFEEERVTMTEGRPVVQPASASTIERLERVVDKQELVFEDDGDNTCAICLEDLVTLNKDDNNNNKDDLINKFVIARLPCNHVFHEGCVVKWLHKNHVCPYCRFELPVD